ncbi:MAG TPA: hypothetical protein PKK23_08330 [Nitrospirales bacterium]|nr:hypothetical protein [Nitrospirales bacterium]
MGLRAAFTTVFFVVACDFFAADFLEVLVFFPEIAFEEANLAFLIPGFLATTGLFVAEDLEATVFFIVTERFFEDGFEDTRRTDFF